MKKSILAVTLVLAASASMAAERNWVPFNGGSMAFDTSSIIAYGPYIRGFEYAVVDQDMGALTIIGISYACTTRKFVPVRGAVYDLGTGQLVGVDTRIKTDEKPLKADAASLVGVVGKMACNPEVAHKIRDVAKEQ